VVVGFGRVVAERDDRVERAILGARLDHRGFRAATRIARSVTPSRSPPPRTTASNARSAQTLRAVDQRDLLGILGSAKLFDLGLRPARARGRRPGP
jgi:hypothetical protein